MKIRTLRNQLIDMTEKEVTTVLTPTGSYQILAHTKDKKKGTILGEYSTEPKAEDVAVYEKYHRLYQKLYTSLKNDYKELAELS